MKIAIIGAGNVGGTLGRAWAKKGHDIFFGIRHPQDDQTRQLVGSIGPKAQAGTVPEADGAAANETRTDDHPVSQLTRQRADDDGLPRASLEHLRRLTRDHDGEIDLFGYHDPIEFPGEGSHRSRTSSTGAARPAS